MMKFLKNGVVILGITDKNMELLKQDKPIKLNLSDLGLPDRTVYIVHGKDEQALYRQFKEFIDPFNTIIKDDNAPNN